MARLIDDLLALSRVSRSPLDRAEVDITSVAHGVAARLAKSSPGRRVDAVIAERMVGDCDHHLLTIAFDNLIGNAWKFTGRRDDARIEVGCVDGDPLTYFVRDNGAGFDMSYASKLFGVFQRLHSNAEFEGTGIGLATVQRIIRRHGGRIWAEGAVGNGATFYFTLAGGTRTPAAEHPGGAPVSPGHSEEIAA
jgi:light-regulated signal transduction histidine kinase (bacteriophytochrome)